MSRAFSISAELPAHRASAALRRQILEYLQRERPDAGSSFPSEYQLAAQAQVTRPTVRKALEPLCREGWLERRPGQGTFVGPRLGLGQGVQPARPKSTPKAGVSGQPELRNGIRLAALVLPLGRDVSKPDWIASGVLAGLNDAAGELDMSIEFIGQETPDIDALRRRLVRSQPDAMVCIRAYLGNIMVVQEAKRLGIHCVMASGEFAELGLPSVYPDAVQGACIGTQHLIEAGYQRVGLMIPTISKPYTFGRMRGYQDALTDAGIAHDARLIHWVRPDGHGDNYVALRQYLDEQKPDALLVAGAGVADMFKPLVDEGLRVPDDLGVVMIDQDIANYRAIFRDYVPPIVMLPVEEMGRRSAALAVQLVEGTAKDLTDVIPNVLRMAEDV